VSTVSGYAAKHQEGKRYILNPEYANSMSVPAPLWPGGSMPLGGLDAARPGLLAGLGPVMVKIDPDASRGTTNFAGARGGLYLHMDVNEEVAAGTAGCLAIDKAKLNKFMCWMRHFKPAKLVVDYDLGTVSSNETPYVVDRSLFGCRQVQQPDGSTRTQCEMNNTVPEFPCGINTERIFGNHILYR
jgi:hypothetical protein